MKRFKLPKKFANKWIDALRSGYYIQGSGELYHEYEDSFCCLGVACSISGVPRISMKEAVDIAVDVTKNFKELPIEVANSEMLPSILISFNDGTKMPDNINEYDIQLPEREEISEHNSGTDYKPLTFSQIADWIEENVDLYE